MDFNEDTLKKWIFTNFFSLACTGKSLFNLVSHSIAEPRNYYFSEKYFFIGNRVPISMCYKENSYISESCRVSQVTRSWFQKGKCYLKICSPTALKFLYFFAHHIRLNYRRSVKKAISLDIVSKLMTLPNNEFTCCKGVATNNELGGGGGEEAGSNRDLFCIVGTNVV